MTTTPAAVAIHRELSARGPLTIVELISALSGQDIDYAEYDLDDMTGGRDPACRRNGPARADPVRRAGRRSLWPGLHPPADPGGHRVGHDALRARSRRVGLRRRRAAVRSPGEWRRHPSAALSGPARTADLTLLCPPALSRATGPATSSGWRWAPTTSGWTRWRGLAAVPDDLAARVAALRDLHSGDPLVLDELILQLCIDDPELFVDPLPPLGELLAGWGLELTGIFVAPPGFDYATYGTTKSTALLSYRVRNQRGRSPRGVLPPTNVRADRRRRRAARRPPRSSSGSAGCRPVAGRFPGGGGVVRGDRRQRRGRCPGTRRIGGVPRVDRTAPIPGGSQVVTRQVSRALGRRGAGRGGLRDSAGQRSAFFGRA